MNISAISAAQSSTGSTQAETKQDDAVTTSVAAPASGGGGKAGGGVPVAATSPSEEDALEQIIEAAKRRVQAIIGPAQVDEVVANDGSINYQKLADLVNEQQMKKLAASGGPIANLLA